MATMEEQQASAAEMGETLQTKTIALVLHHFIFSSVYLQQMSRNTLQKNNKNFNRSHINSY